MKIENPDLLHTRKNVDFGPGFYTTPLWEQAEKWCSRFKRRGQEGIVSVYSIDESVFDSSNTLIFDTYSPEWLDFIVACRTETDTSDYDIVIGGVANDKVFNTVELYFDQLIEKEEAIKRLRFEKPNLQICFRSQSVIDQYLHFEGSETL